MTSQRRTFTPEFKHEAAYLARARGIVCNEAQILVVHGSQQATDLCARLLLDADDAFVFENPGYLMARQCFEATGAHLLPIPVDAQGLITSRLPEDSRARLAYVTLSHQFPMGGVLPIGIDPHSWLSEALARLPISLNCDIDILLPLRRN